MTSSSSTLSSITSVGTSSFDYRSNGEILTAIRERLATNPRTSTTTDGPTKVFVGRTATGSSGAHSRSNLRADSVGSVADDGVAGRRVRSLGDPDVLRIASTVDSSGGAVISGARGHS